MRILLLGGTTEASLLARELIGRDAIYSYAGRTETPAVQPLVTRTGGFGGVAGLRGYLRQEGITHCIDATHPFAAGMSRNAVAACTEADVALIALERPQWQPEPDDTWQTASDPAAAAAMLPDAPARIFLAIGRQELHAFSGHPQHHYLLRLVDPPPASPLPNCTVLLARGPFDLAGDLALLQTHRIALIVAKNAGGDGARAKLDAARALGLPVIVIARPHIPARRTVRDVAGVLDWLAHSADLGV